MKSKGKLLTYVVMLMWIIFGGIGIYYNTNLPSLAGYYASLTLFIGTYLWGEYKNPADDCTPIFQKGKTSSRESMIYVVILLWAILGGYGIYSNMNLNDLTVYFSSLSPFVSSYIIYKTSKNAKLPLFDNKTLVDNSVNNVTTSTSVNTEAQVKLSTDKVDEI